MKRHPLWMPALALAAVLISPLFAPAAPLEENETIKLSPGHTIKVLSVSKMESSKGLTALLVRYQTNLSIDERKALSDEVDAVWKVTTKNADLTGYTEVVISSNEVPKGIILTTNRLLNFIYEKSPDGSWTRLGRAEFMAAQ